MMLISQEMDRLRREGEAFKLRWLTGVDSQSAVRGEYCMFGRSTDAGMTVYEIFK